MLPSSSLSAVVSAVVSLSPTAETDDDGAIRFHRGGGGGGGVTHGSDGSLVVMREVGRAGGCSEFSVVRLLGTGTLSK